MLFHNNAGAVIEQGASVEYAIIAEGVRVGKNARIGAQLGEYPPEKWGVAVVGSGAYIKEGGTVAQKKWCPEAPR
jgi:glucose-1-phosphate adenylyltransferase